MTAVRSPAVAGQFYAGDETGLRKQIESTFTHDIGPGAIPDVRSGEPDLTALVSPHAGYPYSGPVAAHGFGALAESGRPDVVVIVGPNHGGFGEPVAITEADRWETPLGEVPVHTELRDLVADAAVVTVDERTHAGEHSIEVQVPFLQYLFGEVPILPVAMTRQDADTATDLAGTLEPALGAVDGTAVLVASTDLSHYEPQHVAEQKDESAIDRMSDLDTRGLYEVIESSDVSMCGYGPTAAVIEAAEAMGSRDGELLRYATSGDTAGSTAEVVGYASIAIR